MRTIDYKGKKFSVDEDGFLQDFDEYCDEWIEYIKEEEGIVEVTPKHKEVLQKLRTYYEENQIAPMIRILCKETNLKLKIIYELFPSGPSKGACKMAGLPKPTGCV